MRIAWVSPSLAPCGIADYSDHLAGPVAKVVTAGGGSLQRFCADQMKDADSRDQVNDAMVDFAPDVIHVQHEFGVFGGFAPHRYWFNDWCGKMRQRLPALKLSATAHNVLDTRHRLGTQGGVVERVKRHVANTMLQRRWQRELHHQTWGNLDGVIVHSRHQLPRIKATGCRLVRDIAHFVATPSASPEAEHSTVEPAAEQVVMVFGFLSPDKGQDVVVDAIASLRRPDVSLILAGDVRRPSDQSFRNHCDSLARRGGVADRVRITGYVPAEEIDSLYAAADLVVAPFRRTAGSGSIAVGLARGAAVLASDHPINTELNERTDGCIGVFRNGDVANCAAEIQRLLDDSAARQRLQQRALQYAHTHGLGPTAARHVDFFRVLVG